MAIVQKAEKFLDSRRHVGILILRIFIGGRVLYGVVDNVFSWERMLEFTGFLEANHFPVPIVSAVISVYAQFSCAILLIIGLSVRLAALILSLNFLIALLFVHLKSGDSIEGMTPALAMLFGSLTLLFTGSGKRL